MGYCMTQIGGSVFAAKETLVDIHENLKTLWTQPSLMRGGSYGGGHEIYWFAFCNNANPQTDTFVELLRNMRWDPSFDSDGNIVDLRFMGEKYGDEDIIFKALAPFMLDGSYISMEGEDGAVWKWVFENGVVIKVWVEDPVF